MKKQRITVYKTIRVTIALIISVTFISCADVPSIKKTEFLTITGENLSKFYDTEEENDSIVDTLEINKALLQKSTSRIWELNNFTVTTPINFDLREEKTGTFKIDLGKVIIDSNEPEFERIEVEDINVEDMVFQDYSNFFYIPLKNRSILTVESIIGHLESGIDKEQIFYTDNKSFIIYGDNKNFNVIHLNYLESIKKMEVFISYQKSGPFSDLSSRDLFSLALTKLKMAQNFHNKDSLDETDNWNYVIPTMSRYHRKVANLTFDVIKKIPNNVPLEKKVELTLPDFDITIDVHRGKNIDTVQQDFQSFRTANIVSLQTRKSFQKTTNNFIKSIFTDSEINVLNRANNKLLLSDGQKKKIVFFHRTNDQLMLICVSDDYEYSELDDNMDIYFELFKNFEKGIDVFY
ncbi:hypothetical protein [uncultured Aquimarina sp.]|uniref:hypothetical protein n=1 Tax=uncultured Aquimarina sp. TaxID=575652 RepID=UPI0026365223|nr:hypothetical protein [uncultured Aquimarina sp.]